MQINNTYIIKTKELCKPVWTDPPSIGWVTLMQEHFSTYQRYFSIKSISKPLFHRIRSFTKINEFNNVEFPKSISSKDGVWREFPETDGNCTFSKKMSTLKTWNFFFQSISYSNVVVTKQIHFSSTFLKSWVHIFDKVARVAGGPGYY